LYLFAGGAKSESKGVTPGNLSQSWCPTTPTTRRELTMHIRRAIESEAEVLSAIALESKAHWRYSAFQLDAWRGDLTVTSRLVASSPTFVAEVDGRIVGFFLLLPSADEWTLEHFWVLPSHMRRGVGRALLAHAAVVAAAGGAKAISIDADPHAEPFYRRCGARRVGSNPAPIAGSPGRERPQLRLAAADPERSAAGTSGI
jgi:GNAT superfamily N-acetyltransferase